MKHAKTPAYPIIPVTPAAAHEAAREVELERIRGILWLASNTLSRITAGSLAADPLAGFETIRSVEHSIDAALGGWFPT